MSNLSGLDYFVETNEKVGTIHTVKDKSSLDTNDSSDFYVHRSNVL